MGDTYGQGCPIAVALDVIGDRWTLLLLRDLSHAPLRYSDLQATNAGISPNLLGQRLRRLQDVGLVAKRKLPPPGAVSVYSLTDEARDAVLPTLLALGRFGALLLESQPPTPLGAVLEQMRRNGRVVLAKGIDFEGTYRFKLGDHDFGLLVGPAEFEPTASVPRRSTATIELDLATASRLFSEGISIREAEHEGRLRIRGNRDAAVALLDRMSLGRLAP